MTIFKTLDIRGLSFFNGYEQVVEAFQEIKINGVLELILDPKRNFTTSKVYVVWSPALRPVEIRD